MASVTEAAAHIDLMPRRFHDLLASGVIEKAGRGAGTTLRRFGFPTFGIFVRPRPVEIRAGSWIGRRRQRERTRNSPTSMRWRTRKAAASYCLDRM